MNERQKHRLFINHDEFFEFIHYTYGTSHSAPLQETKMWYQVLPNGRPSPTSLIFRCHDCYEFYIIDQERFDIWRDASTKNWLLDDVHSCRRNKPLPIN